VCGPFLHTIGDRKAFSSPRRSKLSSIALPRIDALAPVVYAVWNAAAVRRAIVSSRIMRRAAARVGGAAFLLQTFTGKSKGKLSRFRHLFQNRPYKSALYSMTYRQFPGLGNRPDGAGRAGCASAALQVHRSRRRGAGGPPRETAARGLGSKRLQLCDYGHRTAPCLAAHGRGRAGFKLKIGVLIPMGLPNASGDA
jgi:hypothetical protein